MDGKGKIEFEMVPVLSSNIESVGYNEERQVCKVRFKSGEEYEYANVLPAEYSGLLNAESVGKHLNAKIKGKPCTKCEGEKNAEERFVPEGPTSGVPTGLSYE